MMTLRSTSGSVSKSGYAQHVEKRMCTCIYQNLCFLFIFYVGFSHCVNPELRLK